MRAHKRNRPAGNRAANTESSPQTNSNADSSAVLLNRQVSWWSVHEYVSALLDEVGWWPMVGTRAWCELAHDDPRRLAALYDAAQHWALRVETCQEAECEAARAVSAAADWHGVARGVLQRAHGVARGAYIPRKVTS